MVEKIVNKFQKLARCGVKESKITFSKPSGLQNWFLLEVFKVLLRIIMPRDSDIDVGLLTELVRENGVESLTHGAAIKKA